MCIRLQVNFQHPDLILRYDWVKIQGLIDGICLDCGSPIRVEMKDGTVLNAEPEGIMGYTSVPFKNWFNDLPYA